MKIICAFDSFKGCMTANEACQAAASGIMSAAWSNDGTEVVCLPVSDGGEGMVQCIAQSIGARMITTVVHDPLMQSIEAQYAVSADGKTAYMEMAAASGLTLVPKDKRNPMHTTTYGVGELLLDARRRGCQHIVMGIGGSATCDGGEGMVRCLQEHGALTKDEWQHIDITIAGDVNNPLYGENGAAYIFAPQKGATAEEVVMLDQRLRQFAKLTEEQGYALPQLAHMAGAGAAGGLGYALMAYLGAEMHSGIDLVLDTIDFDRHLEGVNCILTGEGKSDAQSLMGKVVSGIMKRGQRSSVPVHLLSGMIEERDALLNAGFASVQTINFLDEREQKVLMQREVAMQNLKNTVARLDLK